VAEPTPAARRHRRGELPEGERAGWERLGIRDTLAQGLTGVVTQLEAAEPALARGLVARAGHVEASLPAPLA